MKRHTLLFLFSLTFQLINSQETLLLRNPSVSNDKIAFAYGADIWVANKDGSQPQRLTVNPDVEQNPQLSPDGKWIAFTGNYEGNVDAYVVPVTGGMPKRLTYHPMPDLVRGWVGSNKILFASSRATNTPRYSQFFQVDIITGREEAMPIPEASQGNVSPDGKLTAYVASQDINDWAAFKMYRGGDMGKIWVFDNQTYDVTEIPTAQSQNLQPVWMGNNTIYFISDRNDRNKNIYKYDVEKKTTEQVTHFKDFDVKTLYSNGKELAFEQGGKIFILSEGGQPRQVPVIIQDDVPAQRPRFVNGESMIQNADISPTGLRAVFECRGDIVTVPLDKGDIRAITSSPGTCDRSPAWSPNGKYIAYFSDEGGEYQLKLVDQKAEKPAATISLGAATFYWKMKWSPDSRKIFYRNRKAEVFVIDIQDKKPVKVDSDPYNVLGTTDADWSPDSKWIVYSKKINNLLSAVFVYEVSANKSTQVTDGRSEAGSPVFSKDGKYIFFTASTNYGLNSSWLDMSNFEREVRNTIYAIVLSKKESSPLLPESDEEKMNEDTSDSKPARKDKGSPEISKSNKEESKVTTIDFENIDQRIVTLPMKEGFYTGLSGALEGTLLYMERTPGEGNFSIKRYDIVKRKSETVVEGVDGYITSSEGKKMLYHGGDTWGIVGTEGKVNAGDGKLKTGDIRISVDPPQEYRQMFDEVWRLERDFFYVKNLHGADWQALKKKYEVFLPFVAHRNDLSYLFNEMLGELSIGHMYIRGGDYPERKNISVGLLGADYRIDNGYYRIARILSGLNWNPSLRAPLTEPGVNVKEGEYIIAVNGVVLTAETNIYKLFQNTAGKQTRITVNSQRSIQGARDIICVPIESEVNLRMMNWVEGNRKKVDQLSGGKLAYVYMPNTAEAGYTFFNRYYFSQLDKQGVIVDERFNGGGSAADYVIDLLNRNVINYFNMRDGRPRSTPGALIDGPKIMVTNSYAASGGDLMPYMFREKKLGKLVGTTTLGILVGISGYPDLMDGGTVTAPSFGSFSKDGKWIIENEGVHPDVEVQQTPKDVIAGKDPQLEKAIELLLKDLPERSEIKEPAAPVKAK